MFTIIRLACLVVAGIGAGSLLGGAVGTAQIVGWVMTVTGLVGVAGMYAWRRMTRWED